MTETVYALLGILITAAVAYFLIGWTKGSKLRNSEMHDIKVR